MVNETVYSMQILYPTGEFSLNVMREGFKPDVSLQDALSQIKDRMLISGREIVESEQGFDVAVMNGEGVPRDILGLEDLTTRTYSEFCNVRDLKMFGDKTEPHGSVYLMLIPRKGE